MRPARPPRSSLLCLLAFDTVIDGKALQANLSGIPYFRTFTP